MFKKITKGLLQWVSAVVIGFLVVNLLCFGYERPVGWFETPEGASPAIWNPDSVLIHGTEGYGIIRTDKNGYINSEGELGESYVLCMGSSHTQGKEVPFGKNYASLINQHFSEKEGELAVYNISIDANFLPSLIKHFPAAVKAYPASSVITIEISDIDFSPEELEAALNQVTYNDAENASTVIGNMDLVSRIKTMIKEYFPLISLVKSKLETSSEKNSDSASVGEYDVKRASSALEKGIKLIRSQYDGEIIFIYHRQMNTVKDGKIVLEDEKLWDTLEKSCKENNIRLVDMRPVFLDYYENENVLSYGFSNTKPGNGHLNVTGHRLIAETLIPLVEEVMV